MKIGGKAVLNIFRPHVNAAGVVASINTLYRMNVSFTSLLVIHPHRKTSKAWMAVLLRFIGS